MPDRENTRNHTLLSPVKARALNHQFQLSITTDSVVATATIVPSGSMRRIDVAWGDGATSSLSSRPGVPPQPNFGEQDNPLPAGTYQLTHAYAEPEDRQPFNQSVLVRVQDWSGGDELNFVTVTLAPRYRVINYRTRVRLTGPCDPSWNSTSQFDISQVVDGQQRRQWHWEPSNNFFSESQYFVLDDSQVSAELTTEDPGVGVMFVFTESDDWSSDDVLRVYAPLDAFQETETVSSPVGNQGGLFGGSCGLIATYDREVSLIVPLPETGQDVVFA